MISLKKWKEQRIALLKTIDMTFTTKNGEPDWAVVLEADCGVNDLLVKSIKNGKAYIETCSEPVDIEELAEFADNIEAIYKMVRKQQKRLK